MCGIVGYTGNKNAFPILIDSLKRLEYRGYDSLGLAVNDNKKLNVFKEVGEIGKLEREIPRFEGKAGIAHTRWATHGKVNKKNAHPHLSQNKKIAVVHNGIINNFKRLKERLEKENFKFESETDSEIIAHLVDYYYNGNLDEAVIKASKEIEGSYAFVISCIDEPNKIVVAKNGNPIVVGIGEGENFVASDVTALLRYTKKVYYLDDGEIATITNDNITIMDLDGKKVKKDVQKIEWSLEDAQKGGYPHFMLKEIFEQPDTIHQTFLGRISEIEPSIYFEDFDIKQEQLISTDKITILACGTSFYAGLVGKYILENFVSIPVEVELSSEYKTSYGKNENELIIAITQSGETFDTMYALKKAKDLGCKTLAITNVPGSSISRIVDGVIYTRAGPEIGVAATKTFTSQIIVLYLLALKLGMLKGVIGSDKSRELIQSIKHIPRLAQNILDKNDGIRECIKYLENAESAFFIGRNINYPIALEGALKLKEISYIHAEGFAAGELKHGPFALLTKKTPVFAINVKDESYEKMLGNIGEIKAREAPVICVADEHDEEIEKYVDEVLRIPHISPEFSPILVTIIFQLLAYYSAERKGCSIDKPRNLAKSVTVE